VTHSHDIKVRFYELDPYNHLNHSAYVQYFEVARIELLESIGFGMDDMAKTGYHIVVTAIHTKFLASAKAGDTVTIETEAGEMKRVTTQWRQRMRRGEEILATQLVEAAMTRTNGRPTRVSPEFAAAIAPYQGTELA
jgi:acyl-CoA thioester hydrolase